MKTLIYILLALLLVSCGKKHEVPPLSFNTSYTAYSSTVASNGKRVYLIHGFRGNRSAYEQPVFKPFVEDLNGAGYEVITFDLPYTYPDYFKDGGYNYRAGFESQLRTIEAKVNMDRGAMYNIVGGFSFGGLHSMMAMSIAPDLFTAYFAILPVVHMDALIEMQGTVAPAFNPLNEVATLEQHSGLITWGTHDLRVNFNYSIELVNLMDQTNLTTHEYVGLDHTSTPQVVLDTLTWVQSL